MPKSTNINRLIAAIRRIVRSEFPNLTFLGIYEYSIQSTDGTTIDATPVDTSLTLPSISKIILRPSILGEKVKPTVGKTCLIMFVNGSPTRPICISCSAKNDTVEIDAETMVKIAGGGPPAARLGDAILAAGIFAGTVTAGSTKTQIG